MKKQGNFEGLMDEVYKNLYEKKNTKETNLNKFTKEVLLKKNQTSVPDKTKFALMFNHPINKSIPKTSNKTFFDKMSKVYSETILPQTPSKAKSEISKLLSTTKLLSSPYVSNTANTTISSNQASKMSTPIKAKMTRVKSQLETLDDKEAYCGLYQKKKEKIEKSNSIENIDCCINNLNNSRSLRTSLDNFRVDLERFLKKDLSANTSVIISDESEIKKKNVSQISIKRQKKLISSPKIKNKESFNNSNYDTFIKFLPKENIQNTFFTIGKNHRKNMSVKMDSFRTRMKLQNL